eukprot:3321309-Amphidinium_carterae.1
MASRFQQYKDAMKDDDFFRELSSTMAEVAVSANKCANLLGIQNHPLLMRALLAKTSTERKAWQLMPEVVRCHPNHPEDLGPKLSIFQSKGPKHLRNSKAITLSFHFSELLFKLLTSSPEVVFRQDLSMQYQQYRAERKFHDEVAGKRKRQALALFPPETVSDAAPYTKLKQCHLPSFLHYLSENALALAIKQAGVADSL